MLEIKRTDAKNTDLIQLVQELDAYLKVTDGEDHSFYNQFNGLDAIKHCVVAYVDGQAVGCGAIKKFDATTMEIKRMYLQPEHRGKSIADQIIRELEVWTVDLGFSKCVLETGDRQVEAVKFYHKMGYQIIPNYGQYKGMENSNCFEKVLQ
ncbi:MAG: GNAT family N-acetyltransferase [Flavobacteriaceae bacterium]|nr:GNAT family N-acetyltransferase [Flavobacteriaceae bacterium]|tara:strand:+ start:363661 stop:364113 length:453 start_codon:yes stop_codon:yes gene_type:complete